MTVKKLKEKLKNIPDKAEVFIECDYGQDKESAECIIVSRSVNESDPDGMMFEWKNWKDIYDDEDIEEYDINGEITNILITYKKIKKTMKG